MFITSTCGRKPRLLADDRYLFVFLTEKLPILYFLRELFSNQSVRILYIRFTVRREVANLRDFLSLVGLYLFITLIAPEFDFGNIFFDTSLFLAKALYVFLFFLELCLAVFFFSRCRLFLKKLSGPLTSVVKKAL